jgi:hypothetical protein
MKKNFIFTLWVVALGALLTSVFIVDEASAVPSFARQTGKPCSGCHSIWPRLLAPGREFKVSGYTDVAEDYPRIQADNLDLLRLSSPPISVSIISLPYAKSSGQSAETVIPDQIYFYFAGRIAPNIGAFVAPQWYSDTGQFTLDRVKLVGATRVGDNTLGVVFLKSDVGGADPYNTIRFSAYHTVNMPAIFTAERGSGDLFQFVDHDNIQNRGVLVNGKFFSNMIYAAAGMFRGDSHAAEVASDPPDYFGRLVFEYALTGETTASLGGFLYTGQQTYDHTSTAGPLYQDKIRRAGVDFQWQTESTPHIFEAVAVYMSAKDRGAWDGGSGFSDVKFNGYYAELSYFHNRKYGVTVGYDHIKSAEDDSLDKKGPTLNLAYLPWLNTKFSLEYSQFDKAGGVKERDTTAFVRLNF